MNKFYILITLAILAITTHHAQTDSTQQTSPTNTSIGVLEEILNSSKVNISSGRNSVTLFTGETIYSNTLSIVGVFTNSYFKLDSRKIKSRLVKSYTKNGMSYFSLAPANKRSFGKLEQSGKISLYSTMYSVSTYSKSFTTGQYEFGTKDKVNYYFNLNDGPVQHLSLKTIIPVLETNLACKDIVNRLKRRRKKGSIFLIISGILTTTSGILISNAIRDDEFNPAAPVAMGLSITSLAVGFTLKKRNLKFYEEGVTLYNNN